MAEDVAVANHEGGCGQRGDSATDEIDLGRAPIRVFAARGRTIRGVIRKCHNETPYRIPRVVDILADLMPEVSRCHAIKCCPPSTGIIVPVMWRAPSLTKNAARAPTSSMSTSWWSGATAASAASSSSKRAIPLAARVRIAPGEIACARIPFGPSSAAV